MNKRLTLLVLLAVAARAGDVGRIVAVRLQPGLAEVTREVTATVPAGPATVRCTIPEWHDPARGGLGPSEARVTTGDAEIVGLTHQQTTAGIPTEDELAAAKAKLMEMTDQVSIADSRMAALAKEREYLEGLVDWRLAATPDTETPRQLSPDELAQVERLTAALEANGKARVQAAADRRQLYAQYEKQQTEFDKLKAAREKPVMELTAAIRAAAAGKVTVRFTYQQHWAAWQLGTVVRQDDAGAFRMELCAVIRQATDAAWENVAMTIVAAPAALGLMADPTGSAARDRVAGTIQVGSGDVRSLVARGGAREWVLADPVSVADDGSPTYARLETRPLTARPRYLVSLTKDPAVHRTAVFAGEHFRDARGPWTAAIGNRLTDALWVYGDLEVDLGRTDALTAERHLDLDASVVQTVGDRTCVEAVYRITITNTTDQPADVVVREWLPPTPANGSVDLLRADPPARRYDKFLTAFLTVGAKGEQVFTYEFRAEYPSKQPPPELTTLAAILRRAAP